MPDTASPQPPFPSQMDRWMQRWLVRDFDVPWLKWVFLAMAGFYMACLGMIGTGPINAFGHDVPLLLDGGWRIVRGQVPYRDFYLALGPLEYMLTAGGMIVAKMTSQGIEIGILAMGMTVGAWGWVLARRRMPLVPSLLVTAWLIGTATCPTPIGFAPNVISCAMIYNRHGYALLGLILIECAFAEEHSSFWGGISSGVALGLLAFLKLNFFAAAVLLLLTTMPMRWEELRRLGGFLLGSAATGLIFLMYIRFAVASFFADMHLALHARSTTLNLKGFVGDFPRSEEAMTLGVVTVVVTLLCVQGKIWRRSPLRILVLGALVIGTGVLLRRTDTGETGLTMTTLWMVLLLARVSAMYAAAKEKTAIAAVLVLGLGGVAAQFAAQVESLAGLLRYHSQAMRAAGFSVPEGGMRSLTFYDLDDQQSIARFDNGRLYVESLQDGVTLLKQWTRPEESVATLGFQNPFPYILQRQPALGGSPWFQVGNNVSEEYMLSPKRFFGDAVVVMVPACVSHLEREAVLQRAYDPYLMENFALVTKSNCWTLYRKNPLKP